MTKPAVQTRAAQALLSGYAPRSGVADELFDETGAMRPVWQPFIDQLATLTPDQVEASFTRGDQYLRDAGVFYRQYSADPLAERDWPLSHIPVILQETEWETICDGLTQRADLLEAVVADLYGKADLVKGGHLPSELIAQNPEWLRPLVGVRPASGHFLHYLAFEIGRSPDGSWLVLGDRTQAPSGAGFALENRMATSRIFPEPFPRSNVRRLAGFFRAFRDAMEALPGSTAGRTAILTPGPGNDTYFEHTYIARYLGLMLLEGEDLIVRDGTVQVRTISGLQPLGTIWRRLDAAYADPLELIESSQIGTPGLVEAVRQGSVDLVNALGTGILETRALMAFLPKIAEHLLDAPLKIPNIATWWCGQDTERAYVKKNAASMFISEAQSRALPFDIGVNTALGGTLQGAEGQSLADWIDANAGGLVGQEAVTLSTTPAWADGRLEPCPMTVRVFAARTATGWAFLPGGYARIGQAGAASALSMQSGGSVADVWVLRDGPAPEETLFEPGSFRRVGTGSLPSRAADNLFWLGRYVERTEGAIRMLRAWHRRVAETGGAEGIGGLMDALALDPTVTLHEALDPRLGGARASAAKVRDRFAVDGWAALTDLTRSLSDMSGTLSPGDESARALGVLLRKITGFNGLVHENMQRTSGWRFLTFGRALERADGAAAVLGACLAGDAVEGLPDATLEFADSRITHQRRYRIDPTPETLADLIALDAYNPRAVLFQVNILRGIAEDLPKARVDGRVSPLLAALLPLQTELQVLEPSMVTPDYLSDLRARLTDISERLGAGYLG